MGCSAGLKLVLLTDREFFGQAEAGTSGYVGRRAKAAKPATVDPGKMQPGDSVVHRKPRHRPLL